MDDKQRLHLQKMVSENNVVDTTGMIRELKHSHKLRADVENLLKLKEKYGSDVDQLHYDAMLECNFLFTYYTDIYNKIRKDEIDLNILFNALDVLKEIEDNKLDMHEGAFKFGSLLKKIYVDSALKKAEKLNENEPEQEEYKGAQVNISWSQYKAMNVKK